jgi:N-hydroxyarylamine O-acetyltransferase
MTNDPNLDPRLSPNLLEGVLAKLGLAHRPSLDLEGLNALYAAYCNHVPAVDSIRKRIWLAGERRQPQPGAEPTDYFENWLTHGTGGTCWPTNGGVYALVHSLGFDARRIAGSVIMEQYPGTNHGSVVVTVDGVDYLIDGNFAFYEVLRLDRSRATSAGKGIHRVSAVPTAGGFDVLWYQGHDRREPLTFRTEPEHDPVDYPFFLDRYELSFELSVFNHALFICRRFPDFITTLGRKNKITVAPDNTLSKTEVTEEERKRLLVEEFGISEELADALPPDEPGGMALL